MSKKYLSLIVALLIIISCQLKNNDSRFSKDQLIVSTDISNFWKAYDAIRATQDTTKEMEYLRSFFLNNASEGQKKMIEARGYSPEEYLKTITTRSEFWNSIRKNTENIEPFNEELRKGVDQLANIYPDLKHSTIYYTIGNHRSPGTGVDNMVLIGTEFALGDSKTVTFELPEHNQNYYKINPVEHLSFLCVHEYVHTQQKPMVHNLLSLTLYEGIAEFVAIKATGQKSPWKAFVFGPDNEERIKRRFEEDMFRTNSTYNWLWNSSQNEFGTSELGYFVGFQLAARHYDASSDKKAAIKRLIELDFSDELAVENLVNGTNYFSDTLENLFSNFESKRPRVTSITELANDTESVDPNLKTITLNFSEPMNPKTRGFDFGPLGEEYVLRVQKIIGFSEDKKSFSFEIDIEKNKKYQSLVTNRFESAKGFPLKPYLIQFETK